MTTPRTGPGVPFEDETPEQGRVTEDREELPGQPPVREGSPLVDPDRVPGVAEPTPPGPTSPS